MNFLSNLKKYISLNLISLLGYLGFAFLIYFIFINPIITYFFPKFPYISLNTACAYFAISVFLFFIFLIFFVLEFFVFKIKKLQNKKDILHKYLSLIPMWFFLIGLLIGIIAVIFYFYIWWTVTA